MRGGQPQLLRPLDGAFEPRTWLIERRGFLWIAWMVLSDLTGAGPLPQARSVLAVTQIPFHPHKGLGLLLLIGLMGGASGCDASLEDIFEQVGGLPGVDGLLPNADGDPLPDHFDCAPQDPSVHRNAVRSCELEDGAQGEQFCEYGVWQACIPVPGQDCEDGQTREVPCQRCGVQTERCEEGVWSPQGECRDQKACEPGETFENSVGGALSCGSTVKVVHTCTEVCEWGDDPDTTTFAACRRDQCCDGRNCDDAPFRTGCQPMVDIAERFGSDRIIYRGEE